jgi:WW domain-containing oxidoreductase
MWFFNFNRNGPSGFSGASTAEEVTAGVDARGLVAVITGTDMIFFLNDSRKDGAKFYYHRQGRS